MIKLKVAVESIGDKELTVERFVDIITTECPSDYGMKDDCVWCDEDGCDACNCFKCWTEECE